MRRSLLFAGLMGVVVCSAVAVLVGRAQVDVSLRVTDRAPVAVSRLQLGVTHDQYSLDPWGDPGAVARARTLIRSFARYEAQHIYGWGAINPNPSRGVYDWKSLDRRMTSIAANGTEPVIILCCAPDWMTALGTPTSRYPNLPPEKGHVDDFADLARRVALRYPQVEHFIVWNEMKGLWDRRAGAWDHRRYTELYNSVYDAIKSVRPGARIGGPYLVIAGTGSAALGTPEDTATTAPITRGDTKLLDYWMENKRGADFIVIDRALVYDKDRERYSRSDLMLLTRWFGEIPRQVRARSGLPVWFAEDYVVESPDRRFVAAQLAAMLLQEMLAETAVSLRWGPQQEARRGLGAGNSQALFTDTRLAGGGRPLPNYSVYKIFADHFPPGTELFPVETSSRAFEAVDAVASEQAVLVINRTAKTLRMRIGDATFDLEPYGIEVRERVSGSAAA